MAEAFSNSGELVSRLYRQPFCSLALSHMLNVYWKASGGQAPLSLMVQIIKPGGYTESKGFKRLSGHEDFPLNNPAGGEVEVVGTLVDQRGLKVDVKKRIP